MGELRGLRGAVAGRVFPLDREKVLIGRHHHCDVVLEVGAVSREHARILRAPTGFYIEDLNSRNGTFVNGLAIEGQRRLADNDQIRICDVIFRFQNGGEAHPADPDDASVRQVRFDDSDGRSAVNVTSRVKLALGTTGPGPQHLIPPEIKLRALMSIGRNLGSTLRLNEVLRKLLDNLFVIFPHADRGFVILEDPRTGNLVPKAAKQRRGGSDETIRISRTIVRSVMASKEAILSADAADDSRFDAAASIVNFQIHSLMCAPLIDSSAGVAIGAIQIDAIDFRQRFNEDDLELLASVASQAAVAIENAQLHEIALQEKAFERELEVARQVQKGFLPEEPPQLDDYEFFDSYEPAAYLGGDYFDYVPLPEGRIAIVVGDVSGKGVSAALLMAKLSAEVRYHLVAEHNAAAAMRSINRRFCDSRWEDRFITAVLAVLDPMRHEIVLVDAGHLPPLLRSHDGRVRELELPGGLPLGIDEVVDYRETTLRIAAGDTLLLYTDGLPDALNSHNEWYGSERLTLALANHAAGDAQLLGRALLKDVRQFVGRQPQFDDRCFTLLRRKP